MWDVHAQRPYGQKSHRLVLVLGWRSVWQYDVRVPATRIIALAEY
jgi:hypothetical protein